MKRMNFSETISLNQDEDGTIRLNGSRVTVDTLIGAFKEGSTAEQIQDSFPSLSLAHIYSAIAWYLNHQTEAEEYLQERSAEAERLRNDIESHPEHASFREKLRRRREQLIKS